MTFPWRSRAPGLQHIKKAHPPASLLGGRAYSRGTTYLRMSPAIADGTHPLARAAQETYPGGELSHDNGGWPVVLPSACQRLDHCSRAGSAGCPAPACTLPARYYNRAVATYYSRSSRGRSPESLCFRRQNVKRCYAPLWRHSGVTLLPYVSCWSASANSGMVTTNVEPLPGDDCTSIWPPWRSTTLRVMLRPSPSPTPAPDCTSIPGTR